MVMKKGRRGCLTLCNIWVSARSRIETLDHPCLIRTLIVKEVETMGGVRPKVERFPEIIWKDNICGSFIFALDTSVITNSERRIDDGTMEWPPYTVVVLTWIFQSIPQNPRRRD